MTRQKKEILKKLDRFQMEIDWNYRLCPELPAEFYEDIYIEMEKLMEKLANLSHFSTLDRYMWDTHGELVDLR